MAIGGDFGKIFFGGKTTQEVGEDLGTALGSYFGGPIGGKIGGNIGADIGKDLGEIGQSKPDSNPPVAGIDSSATTFGVSQTGMIVPPQQTGPSMMGPMEAGGIVNLFGPAAGLAGKFLSKPGIGGVVGGLGVGAAVDFFIDQFGQQKKLVITRKMQRDVKKLFMMSGGNFNMTAELYRMATGRQITGEQVVKIITKTFKNQGPYVTKAAVRKTRSSIRKMETLCDLKDRLCPPKRRAPARRRTMSTSITQVK